MHQCMYIKSNGKQCSFLRLEEKLYCYWHDPSIPKDSLDVCQKLMCVHAEGLSLEGFELKGAQLEQINLSHACLKGANLYRANLCKAHLHDTDLSGACLVKTDCREANLNQANLRNANLLGIKLDQAKIERIDWGDVLIQEKNGMIYAQKRISDKALEAFIEAEEIYRSLYKMFQQKGLEEERGHMYYRHRLMQRYQIPYYSKKRFFSFIVDMMCGYGEKPTNLIKFTVTFVVFFAFFYFFLGLKGKDQEFYFSFHDSWQKTLSSFFICLDYSLSIFLTNTHSYLTPIGWAEGLKLIQSFLSSFMIALFVVIFNKKMTTS